MAKISFNKLGLKYNDEVSTVQINDVDIIVKKYLSVNQKADFIEFVLGNAIDEKTGQFSPLRIEVYFAIGLLKYYADISFTEKQMADIAKTYDILESNGAIDIVTDAIPSTEYDFMTSLVSDTAKDLSNFNSSFAGMLSMMSSDASNLDSQINDILKKVKDKEGLELLDEIKNIVG